MSRSRLCVPAELRDLLLEFTVSCLLEQPQDVTAYAADFFARLRDTKREQAAINGQQSAAKAQTPDDSIISDEDGTPAPLHSCTIAQLHN